MIANQTLQKNIIAKLKADSSILSILGNSNKEVREQQWAGRGFAYPALRIALGSQAPILPPRQCTWSRLAFSVLCLSEERSSLQADQLAALVNTIFNRVGFDGAAGDGFRFHFIRSNGLNSAIRMSERVWRAEAFFLADLHTI